MPGNVKGDGRYMDPSVLLAMGTCSTTGSRLVQSADTNALRCRTGSGLAWSSCSTTNAGSCRAWEARSLHIRDGAHFQDVVCAQAIEPGVRTFAPKTEVRRVECSVEDMSRATFVKLLPGGPKRETHATLRAC